MSKALEIWRSLSAAMGRWARRARDLDVLLPAEVVLDAVHGHAQHLHAALLPFRVELRHGAELGGADGGEVLGVREDHRPASPTQSWR
jgi:hypothetical protein